MPEFGLPCAVAALLIQSATWFWIDPTNDLVFIGMTQRMFGNGRPRRLNEPPPRLWSPARSQKCSKPRFREVLGTLPICHRIGVAISDRRPIAVTEIPMYRRNSPSPVACTIASDREGV